MSQRESCKNTVVVLLAMIAVAFLLCACGKGVSSQTTKAYKQGQGTSQSNFHTYALPRMDEGNPYITEYTQRDLWVSEHAVREVDTSRPLAAGITLGHGFTDESGYLLPELRALEQMELARSQGVSAQLQELWRDREVFASGEPFSSWQDEATKFETAKLAIEAKHYPKIPAWLANNPPASCCILPSGEIVSVGLLGGTDGLVDNKSAGPQTPPVFALYTKDGEFVKSVDGNWYLLFVSLKQYSLLVEDGLAKGWTSSQIDSFKMGFIGMRNNEGVLVALYDYDGTPLQPLDYLSHKRDEHNFMFIGSDRIKQLYEAQK